MSPITYMNEDTTMELYKVQALLESKRYSINSTDRLPNDTGEQLRLTNGAIVNVFDNGTVNVQGKNMEGVRRLLKEAAAQDSVHASGYLGRFLSTRLAEVQRRNTSSSSRKFPHDGKLQNETYTR